ncbi:MAG: hypothetical protein NTY95_05345 [Bacteroidia bacterium]|nr:hypothetical protein [Bacteroidia bacterium]
MKRKILIAISFILFTLAFNSCEPLGTCKVCRQVTTEIDGTFISEGPEAEYCGADLVAIEAKADIILPNNTKLSWKCR